MGGKKSSALQTVGIIGQIGGRGPRVVESMLQVGKWEQGVRVVGEKFQAVHQQDLTSEAQNPGGPWFYMCACVAHILSGMRGLGS